MAERKKRILWANPYCLLDLSSGASMTVREQLRQLHKLGWEVRVLGATIFDSPNGITRLAEHWEKIKKSRSKIVKVNDGPLTHNLVKTKSTVRAAMTAAEEAIWYQAYTKFLDEFKPDIVYYYGGRTLDLLIGDEAHARKIPVAAYLANGNFKGTRWCRDVDTVITNSLATANFYRTQDNIESVTIGPFVEPAQVTAEYHTPKNIVAINPSLAKGAAIVAAVAIKLEKSRPDIIFEIVESRGNWSQILSSVQQYLNEENRPLKNVIVTPNQYDIRNVYSRTKILLILSLWWESLPRVAIEAMLNGIPCIASSSGGIPEAVSDIGIVHSFSPELHTTPYNRVPDQSTIEEIIKKIISLHDDEDLYRHYQEKIAQKKDQYQIEVLAEKLSKTFITDIKNRENIRRKERKLFLDCGSHDGNSALKYKTEETEVDIISFEPNEALHHHYADIPTELVPYGVSATTGKKLFTIDEIDSDGTTFVQSKPVDATRKVKNEEAPKTFWHCIDIAKIVNLAAEYYKDIILKLDVEGAEYEIIERLIDTQEINKISKVYVEWHWEKCKFTEQYHNRIKKRIPNSIDIEPWDAFEYSTRNPQNRSEALKKINSLKENGNSLVAQALSSLLLTEK